MPVRPVDWQTIHSRPLISIPDCWKHCGGFCCSNDHPDFQFRLMPKGGRGTVVLYLGDEYAWMKQNGHVICGEESGNTIPTMAFDYGGPRPLVLHHAPCAYLGRCDGVVTKPLLCRTYPFLPVLGIDGTIEDVLPASILDATFAMKEGRTLCPMEQRWRLEAALAADPGLAEALRHPVIIFHTRAVAAFVASYRERLASWDGFKTLSGVAFWQAWEMAYLGRRLVDRDAVAAGVKAAYTAIVTRYGDFLA